ncbi:MAG: hypothetical protein ACYS76_15465 [Planctomycetota bacterium]|jgi:hypothetical protein
MEISKEANAILDRVAEIAGAAGGEMIPRYAERFFYGGLSGVVCGIIIAAVGALFLATGIHSGRKSESGDDANALTALVCSIVAAVAIPTGVALTGLNVGDMMAPEGAAMMKLVNQLN